MMNRFHHFLLDPSLKSIAFVVVLAAVGLPELRHSGLRSRAASDRLEGVAGGQASNPFASILGEIRVGLADVLFVKTDSYMHGGLRYISHVDEPAAGGHSEESTHGQDPADSISLESVNQDREAKLTTSAADHAGGEEVTLLIRSKERDFRGFLGDLEREIKPWHPPGEPHVLSSGAELLPLYRMITLANPRFVRAYRLGAMWLGFEGENEQALAFIEEGIGHNPDHPERFQLYLSKTMTLIRMAQDGDPERYRVAIEAAELGFTAATEVRPEGGAVDTIKAGLLWTEDHEDDFLALARFGALLRERVGEFGPASAAARRGLRWAPDDVILKRLADRIESGQSPYQVKGTPPPPR